MISNRNIPMQRRYYVVAGAIVVAAFLVTQRTLTPAIISTAPGLAAGFTALAAPGAQAVVPPAPARTGSDKPGTSVVGPPSVSPALIDAVLAEYNSPAAGKGDVIHDLGVQYGIDPAFLLAFFIHESSAGTNSHWAGLKADGTTTHNVGNIVCTTGWRCYGRFRDYATWDEGIEDWYKLIHDLYVGEWDRTTLEEIIPKYAPASDNNDEARYIAQVRTLVEGWRGK